MSNKYNDINDESEWSKDETFGNKIENWLLNENNSGVGALIALIGCGVAFLLFMTGIMFYSKDIGMFFTNLFSDQIFNKFVTGLLFLWVILFFSKNGYEEEDPRFGVRHGLITLGVGIIIWYCYNGYQNINQQLIVMTEMIKQDILVQDTISKLEFKQGSFLTLAFLSIAVLWSTLYSTCKYTLMQLPLDLIERSALSVGSLYIGIRFADHIGESWLTAGLGNIIFSTICFLGFIIYGFNQILKLKDSWLNGLQKVKDKAIKDYQRQVIIATESSLISERNPSDTRRYGRTSSRYTASKGYSTILDISDMGISEENKEIVFEIDGTNDSVLLELKPDERYAMVIRQLEKIDIKSEEERVAVRKVIQSDMEREENLDKRD